MKKYTYLFLLLALTGTVKSFAQTGNFGIGTTTPGSKLTVNGSFAGNYRIETSTTANIGANDFYVAYNGSANGTLTLPAAISGTGNFLGRIYHIKNTSASSSLTLAANGAELIDNQSGAGVASITIPTGYVCMIISKGTTSGTTWELVLLANSTTTGSGITQVGGNFATPQGSAPATTFTVTDLGYSAVTSSTYSFNLPASKAVFLNFMLGVDDFTGTASPTPYLRCEIFIDGVASGLYQIIQENVLGGQFQISVSGVRNLSAGSHTIEARMIRWFNNGMTSGSSQTFGTLSSVFDASYLN